MYNYNETSHEYKKIVGHSNGRWTIRAEELKKQAKIKEIGKIADNEKFFEAMKIMKRIQFRR